MNSIRFFLTLFTAALFLSNLTENASAQNALPYNNNIMASLSDQRVVRDLELMDDQLETIRELQKEFGENRKRIGEQFGELFRVAPKEEHQSLGKEYHEVTERDRLRIVAQIKEVLLPDQVKRLEQLTAQRKLREEGRNSAGLLAPQIIDYLEISKEQQERIRETSEEVRIRVTREIQAIIEEAKQEILDELTAKQKQRYEELVGPPLPEEAGQKPEKDRKQKIKGLKDKGEKKKAKLPK